MNILPTPVYLNKKETNFLLGYDSHIVIAPSCSALIYRQGVLLQEAIKDSLGFELHLTKGVARLGDISIDYCDEEMLNIEYYQLEIEANGISIKGSDQSIIYGIQTFKMIMAQYGANLSCIQLSDYPDLPHRGFYYDITRGRMPTLTTLKWMADIASRYKLNQLQLYVEHTYFFRDFSEVWRNDTPITPEEIMELDAYCYERGVELIPSIATCSHMYSILRTKQYRHLCELNNPDQVKFTARERMHHHTIDISNPESLEMVKKMLEEFRWLFRSSKFNICADETFDMGKGKSKDYCEEKGMGVAYVSFVKELCDFVIELGCIPMMWGDVILRHQELLVKFPEETVFLNWEYHASVTDVQTKVFAHAGVKFYNCPGVSSWSRLVDANRSAFENIYKMASYVKENHGIGLLNTCWGDFYHTSHTKFSFLGLIYGAHFAWSSNPIQEDELNQMISILEFGKEHVEIVKTISEIEKNTLYDFNAFCSFCEDRHILDNGAKAHCNAIFSVRKELSDANANLMRIKETLASYLGSQSEDKKELLGVYIIAIDGIHIFNRLGVLISEKEYLEGVIPQIEANGLAENLEKWFYYYKRVWRSVSKEGELSRLGQVIEWYGDYLRTLQG